MTDSTEFVICWKLVGGRLRAIACERESELGEPPM